MGLTEEDVEHFLRRGFLIVQSGVSAAVNEAIHDSASEICSQGPHAAAHIGDAILDEIPMLHEVLDAPPVKQAVRSILGEHALLHGHRHLHISSMRDQMWHKDSYWGFRRVRSHRPRWCMVLYYPQETTIDIGPTHVLAGSQYWTLDTEGFNPGEDILMPEDGSISMFVNGSPEERAEKLRQAEESLVTSHYSHLVEPFPLTVPAGSCVLMHYDLFHRGSGRCSDGGRLRCLFKFQFLRTIEPQLPPSLTCKASCSSSSTASSPSEGSPRSPGACVAEDVAPEEVEPILQDIRAWLRGHWLAQPSHEADSGVADAGGGDMEGTGSIVEIPGPEASEVERIAAAYTLARQQLAGRQALVRALLRGEAEARAACYGLCAAGPQAMPLLLPLLQHDSPRVRCLSAIALSESSRPCAGLMDAFASALQAEKVPAVEAGIMQALVSVASRARALEESDVCKRCVALVLPYLRPVRSGCTWRGESACLVVLMAGGLHGDVGHEATVALMSIWEKTSDPYMASFAEEVLQRIHRSIPGVLEEIQGDQERRSCEKKLRLGCDQIAAHVPLVSE
eukprot:CAMPEP_0176016356 /NCGR_PEP_ID=MMETSP0120_2-20121206/7806_1 /TAXON_ID=160619 /ORGANISM="Kryptoperidinium foliaceum, Strain CCMP 1326" /LENGTH=564 /DNA_ID=CAMNT_0017349345 /DNA_START=137 /DNA_END=1831 /DNA_ORIENTATION=+